jgi:hypothetical protein
MIRRPGLLLGVVLLCAGALTGCALTPPVLGGRSGDQPGASDAMLTDAEVAALLILDDAEADPGRTSLSEYRDDVLAAVGEVAPASCAGTAAPLLRDADEDGHDTVFLPGPLFREAPGADLVVTQSARRFATVEAAAAFVEEYRGARAACPRYDTARARVEQEVVDGDLGPDATGLALTSTTSDGSATASFAWLLVHGNVAISLEADLRDDDDRGLLDTLAAEYLDRLAK